ERLATDGNAATFWRTEHYRDGLNKPGVGLVLGAATPVELTHLTVTTDTPGFTAKIEAGSSEQGPFTPVSGPSTVAGTTDFTLNVRSSERYYLVWITKLTGPTAHVNEVRPRRAVAQTGPAA